MLAALTFVFVFAILTSGITWFACAHQQRADVDFAYAAALDLAEAGVNYELRNISTAASGAHQSPGTTVTLGSGTFTVYCANADGTTPWTTSNATLLVVSKGTYKGVSRTVKAACKGYNGSQQYAIYSIDNGKGENLNYTCTGDVGTNSTLTMTNTGSPTDPVNGTIYLNGSGASLVGTGYTHVSQANAQSWQTVSEIALAKFPSGGLTWLATHNDNADATKCYPTQADGKVKDVDLTITGPCNLYFTQFDEANATVTWDDRNGPICIWIGPAGSTQPHIHLGTEYRYGNTPDTHIYSAQDALVHQKLTFTFHGSIYAYDFHGTTPCGDFQMQDQAQTWGQVVADTIDMKDTSKLTFIQNIIPGQGYAYYGYDSSWLEYNPR